jgi:hypothetical protein
VPPRILIVLPQLPEDPAGFAVRALATTASELAHGAGSCSCVGPEAGPPSRSTIVALLTASSSYGESSARARERRAGSTCAKSLALHYGRFSRPR